VLCASGLAHSRPDKPPHQYAGGNCSSSFRKCKNVRQSYLAIFSGGLVSEILRMRSNISDKGITALADGVFVQDLSKSQANLT
jgi:hypothetical protein